MEYVTVYVIDNNSSEDIQSITSKYAFCSCLLETKPGAYHARNLGLNHIPDDMSYVGFTDADCIPDPSWIENAVKVLGAEKQKAVGGKVTVFSEHYPESNLVEDYEICFAFPQETYIKSDHFAVTANLFTTLEVVKKVGPFNSELFSGGDAEWGNRMRLNNVELLYSDSVIVKHPARDSLKKITSKVHRTVGGCYQQRETNDAMRNSFGLVSLIKGFMPPIHAASKLWRDYRHIGTIRKVRLICLTTYLKFYKNYMKIKFKLGLVKTLERF
jgi:glycosyltransferase involved in cell wall biosynthesis